MARILQAETHELLAHARSLTMEGAASTRSAPRVRLPDSTLSFLRDPYGFISRRCRAHQSDVFETRLRFERVFCMTGKEASELFYDNSRFRREGAAPSRFQQRLFGQGGVQGLDGEARQRRKAMFMALVEKNHRCPGEGMAVELMRMTANFLSSQLDYQVPKQDLSVDQRRLSALPRSKMILRGIRRRAV